MRHELHTEITIEAPKEVVWQVLIDLDTNSRAGFEAMNDALAARCEDLAESGS